MAGAAPNPQTEAARSDAVGFLLSRVEEELTNLPDDMRAAFVLFRFEGMPTAEIANVMDVPVKTVETRLRRATLILAQRLGRYRDLLP